MKKHFYCGQCGKKIKVKRDNLTQLIQQKFGNKYLVHVSYLCNDCGQITDLKMLFNSSISDIQKRIGVYSENKIYYHKNNTKVKEIKTFNLGDDKLNRQLQENIKKNGMIYAKVPKTVKGKNKYVK